MGWLRDRLFGGRSRRAAGVDRADRVVQGRYCDCCNAELGAAGTYYYLTTRHVVLSELYWSQAFTAHSEVWRMFATSQEQLLGMFQEFVGRMAGQASPWSICETCAEYFFFDRDQARSNAVGQTPPSGTGAVDPSGCLLFAALGWERAMGSWPRHVQRPPVLESCDFCDKTVYEGEIDSFVCEAAYQRDRAEGKFEAEPLRPAHPARTDDETGWHLCFPCMSRHLAFVDRKRRAQP